MANRYPEKESAFRQILSDFRREKVVFQSGGRGTRKRGVYSIEDVTESAFVLRRLSSPSNAPQPVNFSYFSRKIDLFAESDSLSIMEFDGTSATVAGLLLADDFDLTVDRKAVWPVKDEEQRVAHFLRLLNELNVDTREGSPRLYKPVILWAVLRAIKTRELTENRIEFDYVLPRTIEKLKELGVEAGASQIAQGFFHLTGETFWMLAYKDPDQYLRSTPSPKVLREIVSHAVLKHSYWQMLRNHLDDAISTIESTWWPDHVENSAHTALETETVENSSRVPDELFIRQNEYDNLITGLNRKKNIVLQGAPGVGKSFLAKRLAKSIVADDSHWQMIQFHQSYSYEDFIQGFRPNETGNFSLEDGVFFRFCDKAKNSPEEEFVFIIDEMNRGNLSKIFGELMLLLEHDKRGEDNKMPLTYSPHHFFFVPENVLVIGLMNTADRSLAMVDYALRRRFVFFDVKPQFKNPKFRAHLARVGVEGEVIESIVQKMPKLNSAIRNDTANLGPGFEIGHSFFCPPESDISFGRDWYEDVVEWEIRPLLNEYWYDNPAKVLDLVEGLLE